ncbi:MAG: hypothetical protein IPM69_18735 [Ignavibacteria bacterium]|nr:hypothetical protein [Ignavibacteria bacterium]
MDFQPQSNIIYTSQLTITDWIGLLSFSIIPIISAYFSFTGWCKMDVLLSIILSLFLGGILITILRRFIYKFIIVEDKIIVTNHNNRSYKELYPAMIDRIEVCTPVSSGLMFNIYLAGKRKHYNVSIDVSDRTLCEIISVCRTMGIFVHVDRSIAKQLGIEHQN